MFYKTLSNFIGCILAASFIFIQASQATSSSYSWHYTYPVGQPGRYIRYSSSSSSRSSSIRRPAAVVHHRIGNHVTSYQLPPLVPVLEGSRWLGQPYHTPVLQHPPSFLRPRPPMSTYNFPGMGPAPVAQPQEPPSRVAPTVVETAEPSPASSVFMSSAEPVTNPGRPATNPRPVVSPAVAGRPAAHSTVVRRPGSYLVPPAAPARSRPPVRPTAAVTVAAPNYQPTSAPFGSSTVNDADIGFEVASNSDSASLAGPVVSGPVSSIIKPIRNESPSTSVNSNEGLSSAIDPSGF